MPRQFNRYDQSFVEVLPDADSLCESRESCSVSWGTAIEGTIKEPHCKSQGAWLVSDHRDALVEAREFRVVAKPNLDY